MLLITSSDESVLFPYTTLFRSEAQKVLVNAHGGFAVDRRPGHDETYFALPGAGILQISADLKIINMSGPAVHGKAAVDRKSTRLNSSHLGISYAGFCLKKKNKD